MSARMRWILVAAALSVPTVLWTQHPVAAAGPAIETARPAPPPSVANPAPDDDDLNAEALMALDFDDELMALGDGDEGDGEHMDQRMHRMGPRRGMGMGPMGHGGPGLRGRFAELNLTGDQRTKLQALHEAQARKAVQRRADMQLARIDLHKLMREDRPNMASVNAQIDKMARLHAEAMKARFETHMQARALLTPEQVKKLREGMPGMHHEMGDFDM